MLIDLQFNIDSFNNDFGVSYTRSTDQKGNLIIEGIADHTHDVWKTSGYDKPFMVDCIIQVEAGIYNSMSFNFDHTIEDNTNSNLIGRFGMIIKSTGEFITDSERLLQLSVNGEVISDYGVCDHYKQVLEKYPFLYESEKKFVLSLVPISRSSQPKSDGWRWHKWGEYIGDKSPQCEYLADEKDIDLVYVFAIHSLV